MKRVFPVAMVAATALISGCVSSGTKINASTLQAFQVGTTTKEDVEAKLGNPEKESTSNQSTNLEYVFKKDSMNPLLLVPIVDLWVGDTISHSTNVYLTFDEHDKLVGSRTEEKREVHDTTQ